MTGVELGVLLAALGAAAVGAGLVGARMLAWLAQPAARPRLDGELARTWSEVARGLDEVTIQEAAHSLPASLRGRLHGFGVTVDYLTPAVGGLRVDVDGAGSIPIELSIKEGGGLERSLATGDPGAAHGSGPRPALVGGVRRRSSQPRAGHPAPRQPVTGGAGSRLKR